MITLKPDTNWREFKHPTHGHLGIWYQCGGLTVCVAKEHGYWHLSISHPLRYPTWSEIYTARYDLLPEDIHTAILLPKKAEYVNIHPNCFHVYQLRDQDIPSEALLRR